MMELEPNARGFHLLRVALTSALRDSNQWEAAYTRKHLSIYSKDTNEQLLSLRYLGEGADLQLDMRLHGNAEPTPFKVEVAEDQDSTIQFRLSGRSMQCREFVELIIGEITRGSINPRT